MLKVKLWWLFQEMDVLSTGIWREVLNCSNLLSSKERLIQIRRKCSVVLPLMIRKRKEEWPSFKQVVWVLIFLNMSMVFSTLLPPKTARSINAPLLIQTSTLRITMVTQGLSIELSAIHSGTARTALSSWPAPMTGQWECGVQKKHLSF